MLLWREIAELRQRVVHSKKTQIAIVHSEADRSASIHHFEFFELLPRSCFTHCQGLVRSFRLLL